MTAIASVTSSPAPASAVPESAAPASLAGTRQRMRDIIGSGGGSGSNVFAANCPSRVVLDHVTSKWGVLVIVALSGERLRWGELRRCIEGISEKMLAQTLRVLEADGMVLRTVEGTIPPRVDYELTELGQSLAERLIPLLSWVGDNAAEIVGRRAAASA